MENKFIIGTFYTKDTPYDEVFSKLFLPSAMSLFKEHGLKWKVYVADNQGSWIKNVAQKPLMIFNMLETMKSIGENESLVFLDADSTIEKYPNLFNEIPDEYEIALHYLDWQTWYKNGVNRKELLTGTMFFRNTEKVRALVKEWYDIAITKDIWEQQVLEKLLPTKDIKVYELPIEYCYIKTMPSGIEPHVKCDPVILHHQASRKLKRIINGS